ncbi:hypothetical protein CSC12_0382 [Klebsiella michiganensis]|nr:hypothetical protein CSC12_0382 [Klebsiella michiganensis]
MIDANQYAGKHLSFRILKRTQIVGVRNKLFLSFIGHEKAQLWA